ncbi:MAG: chemotaxis protein CheW [Cellvibrionales bacterium]|nr:chemotaxis protein CheW [Cellvibrionales bacterium]
MHDEILDILSQHATFQPKDLVSTVEETERYLRVSICEKTYAIPLENVKRVAQFFPMEKISDYNDHIQGAIDLDGSIIPVLALEKALALKRQTAEGEYVIVSKNQHEWAICVDLAQGIVDVPVSNIKHMQAGNSHYINGIAHIDDNLVPLLDFSILQNQKESTIEHQQ